MTKYHGVWGALAYGAGTFALVIAGAGCGARTGVSLTQGEPNADRGGSGGAQTSGGEAAHAGSFGSGGHVDRICGAVIDDLEDGTGRICQSVDGRQGAWYAFHDNTADGMQWPAKTAPGTPILPSLVDGRGAASRRAMHTYGDHFSDWGSGIGFDLNFDGTTYRTYDARAYYGVGFWARTNYESSGYSYQRLRFRVSTAPTTAPAYGGTCAQANCAGPRGLELQTSPLWRHYEVSFDELAIIDKQHQIDTDLERLTNVQFMTSRGEPFDFWIDDVVFLEEAPSCCPAVPACQGGVHFADSRLAQATSADGGPEVTDCAKACRVRELAFSEVQSLSGVECLTNLESLQDYGGPVDDLSPLSNLVHLTRLTFQAQSLTNLAPLAPLTGLRVLGLAGNQIANLGTLRALTRLNVLDLGKNQISDISALAGLTELSELLLNDNRLTDLSSLRGLSIHRCSDCSASALDFSSNLLTDLSPLLSINFENGLNLNVRNNRLDCAAQAGVLQSLRARGANIETDCN